MLKFFRKIRQKLLTEGKLGKYLIYASGEILLVMIGILLALQVNNWNENRKKSNLEIEVLQGLKTDLEGNVTKINYRIKKDSIVIERGNQLLSILEDEKSIYNDSMRIFFGSIGIWIPVHLKRLAYENLKENGLSIISNDTLIAKVVTLYDDTYAQQEDIEELFISGYIQGLNIKFNHLRTGDNILSMYPNNFELIKESDEFINYLSHSVGASKQFRGNYKNIVLKGTQELINDIDKEINRLEN